MKQPWKRIEAVADASGAALPGGADDAELDRAQGILGIKLPADVRISYKTHDGTNRAWVCELGYLMPLFVPENLPRRRSALFNAVTKRWSLLNELLASGGFGGSGFESKPTGPIRTDHWNPNWIPITDNECGDHLCIDLSPAKGGKKGQIIEWDHEVGAKRVIAPSFSAWLESVAASLASGDYKLTPQ